MHGLEPTRAASISERGVYVFDGLASEQALEQVLTKVEQSSFVRTEAARPETAAYKHAVAEYDLDEARSFSIYASTERAVATTFRGRHVLFRAYCNAASFGDMLFSHTDCPPEQSVVTALWYLCRRWDIEWGGETLFFDDSGDAVFVTTPKPGRLVLFDGAITHAGRPPNPICPDPRLTFAYKFVNLLGRGD